MGWPTCCRPGCTRWPAGAELLLCSECVKVPAYVHAEHRRVLDLFKATVAAAVRASNVAIAAKDGPVAIPRKEFTELMSWAGIYEPFVTMPGAGEESKL